MSEGKTKLAEPDHNVWGQDTTGWTGPWCLRAGQDWLNRTTMFDTLVTDLFFVLSPFWICYSTAHSTTYSTLRNDSFFFFYVSFCCHPCSLGGAWPSVQETAALDLSPKTVFCMATFMPHVCLSCVCWTLQGNIICMCTAANPFLYYSIV